MTLRTRMNSSSSNASGGQDQGMDEGGEEPPEYPIEDEEECMDPRPRWIQETLTAELGDDFFHARPEELIRR